MFRSKNSKNQPKKFRVGQVIDFEFDDLIRTVTVLSVTKKSVTFTHYGKVPLPVLCA